MSGTTRRNSCEEALFLAKTDLLSMRDEDLRVRAEIVASGTLFDTYHQCMEEVHVRNASRLANLLEAHGWPDATRFGSDGEEAAWLILMHSISAPAVMRLGHAVLTGAVDSGASSPDLLARLEDRIRTLAGQPQVYGTILDWDDAGELSPLPIEAPERVDELRASVGLPPLAEHVARCRHETAATGSRPPSDLASKAAEHQDWLRRTGWR